MRGRFFQILGLVALATGALATPQALLAEEKGDVAAPHFTVTWVGGPTVVIAFGSFTILTDPTLGEAFAMGDPNDTKDHKTIRMHRRLTPISKIDNLKAADLLLLSHAHEDHFDQQAWTELDHSMAVILPIADMKTVGAKGFHHSTYSFYREPISELAERSQGKPFRLDLVAAGSTVVYP